MNDIINNIITCYTYIHLRGFIHLHQHISAYCSATTVFPIISILHCTYVNDFIPKNNVPIYEDNCVQNLSLSYVNCELRLIMRRKKAQGKYDCCRRMVPSAKKP